MPLILGTNSIKDTGYEVANSVRFENDGSNDSFSRDMVTATSRRTFTVSMWLKKVKNNFGSEQYLFHSWQDSNNRFISSFDSSNILHIRNRTGGSNTLKFNTNQKFLDVSAWYNIIIAIDTTQSTESNRFKLYVNGTQVTSFSTSDYPSLNADMSLGTSDFDNILGIYGGGGNGFSGYMCEMVYIDGLQLTPTSFGEFDSDTDIWKPIDVSGLTFGNNGFHLDFENSSNLGADVSGEGHNFTVNNLTSIDQSTDTCTNNAVTFTDTHPTASNFTISQGGLKINKSGAGTFGLYGSSIMLSSGKWYWEVKFTGDAGADRTRAGIAHYDSVSGTSTIQDSYSGFEFTCTTSGRFSFTTVGGSATEIDGFNNYSTGDIIRFALDMDNQRLYVGRNADWFNYSSSATGGDPTSGSGWLINDTTILKAPQTIYAGHAVGVSGSRELEFNFGATNTFTVSSGNSDGNGYGNFEYSVPSGYYAINTKNLAEYG